MEGSFTIGLAVALAELGLDVTFHSDPDPDIHPDERALYKRAKRIGVVMEPAVDLRRLGSALEEGAIPVVFYRRSDGGHFSPMLGIRGGKVLLPYDLEPDAKLAWFRRAWKQPGFCRQALIARRPPNRRLQPTAAGAILSRRG